MNNNNNNSNKNLGSTGSTSSDLRPLTPINSPTNNSKQHQQHQNQISTLQTSSSSSSSICLTDVDASDGFRLSSSFLTNNISLNQSIKQLQQPIRPTLTTLQPIICHQTHQPSSSHHFSPSPVDQLQQPTSAIIHSQQQSQLHQQISSSSSTSSSTSSSSSSSLPLNSYGASSGISRASSARSTSSVQAVPFRTPARLHRLTRTNSSSNSTNGNNQSRPTRIPSFMIPNSASSSKSGSSFSSSASNPPSQPSPSVQSPPDADLTIKSTSSPPLISSTQPTMTPIPQLQSQLQSLNLPNYRTDNSPHLPPQNRMDDSDSLLNRSDSSSITTSTITASPPNLSSLHNSPNSNLSKSSTSTIQERPRKGIKDFKVGEVLGEGSYSTVYLAKDRSPPHRAYALKVLDKRHIQKEKKVKYVSVERDTLNILDHFPGCLRLYATFQDETSLYYLLEYAEQGEILRVIKYLGSLSNECARYYGAQILSAIEYMHSKGIIHRDIKPENILLDSKMKVKIADFGSAKILTPEKETQDVKSDGRSHSFVGTAEYVSPELLINKVTTKSSDLWAFGCVLFQMISGKPPFKSRSEYLTFQKITQLDYQFPDNFPTEARDLISKLLVIVPSERLSIEEIKRHKFFDGIDWGSVWDAEAPSLRPGILVNQELLHPNLSSQGMDEEHLKTEPDGGNVASSGGTSSPKVIDVLEPDDAQEEIGVTPDEFSGESSCSSSEEEEEEEEEQEEDEEENGKDDNEGEYEDCDGRFDAQAARKFKTNSRVSSQSGQVNSSYPLASRSKSWLGGTGLRKKNNYLSSGRNKNKNPEMTWVEIFLPNELIIYSSIVNQLPSQKKKKAILIPKVSTTCSTTTVTPKDKSISSKTMMILKQQRRLTSKTKILKDTYLKKFNNNSNSCAINSASSGDVNGNGSGGNVKSKGKGRKRQLILTDFPRLLNVKENKKNSRVKIKDEILFKELPKLNMDQKYCLRDELGNESLNDYERASSRQRSEKSKKTSLSFIKRGGSGGEIGDCEYDEEGKKKFLIFKRIEVESLTNFTIETYISEDYKMTSKNNERLRRKEIVDSKGNKIMPEELISRQKPQPGSGSSEEIKEEDLEDDGKNGLRIKDENRQVKVLRFQDLSHEDEDERVVEDGVDQTRENRYRVLRGGKDLTRIKGNLEDDDDSYGKGVRNGSDDRVGKRFSGSADRWRGEIELAHFKANNKHKANKK